MMKKQVFIWSLLFVLLITSIYAIQQQTLGTFKKGDCINLKQTCANCTYINFTSVINPDSTELVIDLVATKRNSVYNYSLCNATQLGTYVVTGIGDISGEDTVFIYDFYVNPSGTDITVGTAIAFGSIIAVLILLIITCIYLTVFFSERENGLTDFFFLGIFLFTSLTIRLSSVLSTNIVVYNLINITYRVILYLFWFLFLVVLVKLMMKLQIRKNPPPTMGSPLKAARQDRLNRQGRQ